MAGHRQRLHPHAMNRRVVLAAAAATAVILALCGGIVGLPLLMFGESQAQAANCQNPGVRPAGLPTAPASGHWSAAQVGLAAVIVATGRAMNVPARGYAIA